MQQMTKGRFYEWLA